MNGCDVPHYNLMLGGWIGQEDIEPFLSTKGLANLSDWGQQSGFEVKIGPNECNA